MRRCRFHALYVLAAAVAIGGCATGSSPIGPVRHTTDPSLIVSNNNWMDMRIYLSRGGARIPLGTVGTLEQRRLRLPQIAAASALDMHLVAEPIGSSASYASSELELWPGREVEWRIENNLNLSVLLLR